MNKRFRKKLLWIAVSLILVFIAMQFVREPLQNPPVTAFIRVPDSVGSILLKSCYNCHSNITKLSWYDRIAPASWVVTDHVLDGRRRLNFSEWDSLNRDQQKAALFESLNQMQFQSMPLDQYVLLHPSSKLSPADILVFKNYLSDLVIPVLPDTAKYRDRDKQFAQWVSGNGRSSEVKSSPNGIAFNPDYKNWVVISSTERFDNGTLRVITGNEIAVNAIKTGHTRPWPDGSILVKIAWYSLADAGGNLFPGAFKQVEFMIRDKNKYAGTEGWGFARWVNGLKLEPYGKDPLFTTECVNCHRPMKKNDYVFTEPIDLRANKVLEGKLISSSVNRSDNTMAVIYGNGSVQTRVTWNEKEDDHWYGARIPGQIKNIESVQLMDSMAGMKDAINKLNLNQAASILP